MASGGENFAWLQYIGGSATMQSWCFGLDNTSMLLIHNWLYIRSRMMVSEEVKN